MSEPDYEDFEFAVAARFRLTPDAAARGLATPVDLVDYLARRAAPAT